MWDYVADKWELFVFAMGAFLGLRTKRIDERIKEMLNPSQLHATLERIEAKVDATDTKVDQLTIDVTRLNALDEARYADGGRRLGDLRGN
jgi:hypothetical protein